MKNINDSFVIGNIASDIEVKNTEKSKYVRFSVSCVKKLESSDGQVEFRTSFVNVIAWWNLATKVWEYKKWDPVIIKGKINVSSYETENGEKKTNTNIVANYVDKTTESEFGKNINRHIVYGHTWSFDEEKVRNLDNNMIAVKNSIAVNEYIQKPNAPENGSFEERYNTVTNWINIRLFVSKKFYEENLSNLIGKKWIPLMVEGQLMTTSFEWDEGQKIYYTYLNVNEDWILNIFEKTTSNYSNDETEMTQEEFNDEIKKKSETKKEDVKDEEFKDDSKSTKSRFEDDEYEEVSIEETPF